MSGSAAYQESRSGWNPPPAKPQHEMEWQAWVAKGRERDRQTSAAYARAMKWVPIAVLLVIAAFWSHLTAYGVVVRFIVAGAALAVMFQALHAKHYAFVAVYGALALLYNPIVPMFGLSGGWERALVLMTAVPFVASLAWDNTQVAYND